MDTRATEIRPLSEKVSDELRTARAVHAVKKAALIPLQRDFGDRLSHLERIAPGRIRQKMHSTHYRTNKGDWDPILPVWQRTEKGWACVTNTTKAILLPNGLKTVANGPDYVRLRPLNLQSVPISTLKSICTGDQTSPSTIALAGLYPDNIVTRHTVDYGSVQEWLEIPNPIKGDLTLSWSVDSNPALTLKNNAISCGSLRILPPVAFDANKKQITAAYTLTKDVLILTITAEDLAGAAYPLQVDPSSTIEEDASSTACYLQATYRLGGIFQVDLPAVTGTVTAAEFNAYCYDALCDDGMYTYQMKARTSADATWDTSSTVSTLNDLGYTADLDTVSISQGGTGWKTWDVLGVDTDSDAIAAAYDGDNDPGSWSVRIINGTTTPTWAGSMGLTWFADGAETYDTNKIWFRGPTYATTSYRPYLEITYEAPDATADAAITLPAIEFSGSGLLVEDSGLPFDLLEML